MDKLVCTGVYIFFLILLQGLDCGYSLEPPQWCGSVKAVLNCNPQSIFSAKIRKNIKTFQLKIIIFTAFKNHVPNIMLT